MPRPGHTGMVFVAETKLYVAETESLFVAETELYVAETESLFVAETETETELFVANSNSSVYWR